MPSVTSKDNVSQNKTSNISEDTKFSNSTSINPLSSVDAKMTTSENSKSTSKDRQSVSRVKAESEMQLHSVKRKQIYSEMDLQLLRTMNNKLSDSYKQNGASMSKIQLRQIPKLLTNAENGYASDVYVMAAKVFERFAERSSEHSQIEYPQLDLNHLELNEVVEERIKLQIYDLAFRTRKYQSLFEEVLISSGYLNKYPINEETAALIMVMLSDFQNRNFTVRPTVIDDEVPDIVKEVENTLIESKVALAAALAKLRVKNQSLTIDYHLPKTLQNYEKVARNMPQYFWINTMKTTLNNVVDQLISMGFEEFSGSQQLIPKRGKIFRKDDHCEGVMMIPRDQVDILNTCELVEDGLIVLQDKTSCLGVMTVESLLSADGNETDIIHTEVASGLTTAHLAVRLYQITKRRSESRKMMFGKLGVSTTEQNESSSDWAPPTVFAFGVHSEPQRFQLESLFDHLNIENITLVKGPFISTAQSDSKFSKVKVIIATPQCTRSAVANPVDFMLTEGDTDCYSMLRELSSTTLNNRAAYVGSSHLEIVRIAMKNPYSTALVYLTRSRFEEENEKVLNDAIERQDPEQGSLYKLSPITLPLSSNDMAEVISDDSESNKKFFRLKPTNEMNGCFIGVLVKYSNKNKFSPNPSSGYGVTNGRFITETEAAHMIKSHSTTKSFKKKHIINKQPKQKIFPVRQFPNPKVIDYKIETNTNEVQTNVIKGSQKLSHLSINPF